MSEGKNIDSIRAADILTRDPVVVKQDTETDEIIEIILQKIIILFPVVEDEEYRSMGLVTRFDILRQNLNEKFISVGQKVWYMNIASMYPGRSNPCWNLGISIRRITIERPIRFNSNQLT